MHLCSNQIFLNDDAYVMLEIRIADTYHDAYVRNYNYKKNWVDFILEICI